MTAYIIRRVMQSVAVMFVMLTIVFFGVNVIGNPVDLLVPPTCGGDCFDQAVRGLGLDRPVYEQYFIFLRNVVQGDFGNSFVFGLPPLALIETRLPATLELAFASLVLCVTVGIPLGVWAGFRPDSISGRLIMGGSILGFSLPSFWVGLMMILLFAVTLGWVPTTGRGETVNVGGVELSFLTLDGLRHMILPVINLSLFFLALLIRLVRAGIREVLFLDYVRFAYAKGLTRRRIIFVHVLKNIMIPVVTVIGLELGGILAFAVVTETIFAWPGMGRLLIASIELLDRPVILAYMTFILMFFIAINLVVDILYSILDPRIRLQKEID